MILCLHLTALEPAAVILWSRCSQTLPTRATAGSALLSGPPQRAGERPAALTLPSVTAMALRSFDTPHSDAWTGCTCCGSNIFHHVVDSATMASFVLLVNTTQHRGGHKHFFCCIFCVSGLAAVQPQTKPCYHTQLKSFKLMPCVNFSV